MRCQADPPLNFPCFAYDSFRGTAVFSDNRADESGGGVFNDVGSKMT